MRDQQTQHGKAAQRVQNPNSISHWHTSINVFTFEKVLCKRGASAGEDQTRLISSRPLGRGANAGRPVRLDSLG
jgi:hypothetical protein